MEKKLLVEINRNLNLMGLTVKNEEVITSEKKLIIESSILKSIIRKVGDVLKPQEVVTSGGGKGYKIGDQLVKRPFYNNVKKLMADYDNNISSFLSNPDNVRDFARLIRNAPELVDDFYTNLVSDLITQGTVLRNETQLYNLLSTQKKSLLNNNQPFDIDTELRRFIVDDFEREVLSEKIKSNFKLYEKGEFKPSVSVRPSDVTVKTLSDDQKAFLIKRINSNQPFWTDFFRGINKGFNELTTEIESVSAGFYDDLLRAQDDKAIASITKAYSVEVARKLQQINLICKDAALQAMEQAGIPEEIMKVLKTSDEVFFKQFRELVRLNPDYDKIWDNFQGIFASNFKVLGDFFTDLFKLRIKKVAKELFDPSTDMGNFFYTAQWAGLNRLYKLAVKTGIKGNKLEFLWKAVLSAQVGYLSGWFANTGIQTFYEIVIKNAYNATLGALTSGICDSLSRVAKQDWECNLYLKKAEYLKDIEGLEKLFFTEILNNSWNVLKSSSQNHPFLTTAWNSTPGVSLTSTWRYTLWARGLENLTDTKFFLNQMGVNNPEEQTKELKEEINEKDPSTKTETDTISNNLLTDTTTNQTPAVTTYTNNPEGFKKFLKDTYPTKNFNNPIQLGGNKYKISDDYPVTFEYENGTFIAK